MPLTREEAIAALGLGATGDVDATAVQRAFERLARRYPQASFPERFHRLLDARDALLDAARGWREQLESRMLDLEWLLARIGAVRPAAPADRGSLQQLLRAGFLAEPLPPIAPDELLEHLMGLGDDAPF